VGRRALIAWDGTREAVRAVHGALPLLDRAEARDGHLCRRSEGKYRAIPTFSRVDFQSSETAPDSLPTRSDLAGALSTSEVLLSRAAEMSADLIVSGAYHHSQLREALIGGVSRDLMNQMTVPVLFSH
jgi:nucleotide-binding universal stress UspA family protein